MTLSTCIQEFDLWRATYALKSVRVVQAGTTTLAAIFYDPALTQPAPNPQTLLSLYDANGADYGKFAAPLYTGGAYSLIIDSTQQTAVQQPGLQSLGLQDASNATVTPSSGQQPTSLQDWISRSIDGRNYGPLSEDAGSAANTSTLVLAIGAAAAQGGGFINLPAGVIPLNKIVLPEGVVLRGQGQSTTMLQSQINDAAVTLAGDGSGLMDLTLDGIGLTAGSIGALSVNHNGSVFERVTVTRFETGIALFGGGRTVWRNLSVTNCKSGTRLIGDAQSQSVPGSSVKHVTWIGGQCSLHSTVGVELAYKTFSVVDVTLHSVIFESNAGCAVINTGARNIRLQDCSWASNIKNLGISDGTDTNYASFNTTNNFTIDGGTMESGAIEVAGVAAGVSFIRLSLASVSLILGSIEAIVLQDCEEDAGVSVTGDQSKILRTGLANRGVYSAVTNDNNAVPVWSHLLDDGASLLIECRIIARQINGTNLASFHVVSGFNRPPALAKSISVTSAVVAGEIITGATSGASARAINAVNDASNQQTLSLIDIAGAFVIGERIGGSAGGNGSILDISHTDAVADNIGQVNLRPPAGNAVGTYQVNISPYGGLVQVRVTGAVGHNVEWLVEINVLEA